MEYQTYGNQVKSIRVDSINDHSKNVWTRDDQFFCRQDERVDGPWEREYGPSLADVVLHYGRTPNRQARPFLVRRERNSNSQEIRYEQFVDSGMSESRAFYLSRYKSLRTGIGSGEVDRDWRRASYRTSGYKLIVKLTRWYSSGYWDFSQPVCKVDYHNTRGWVVERGVYSFDQWGHDDSYLYNYLSIQACKSHNIGQAIVVDVSRQGYEITWETIFDFILGIRNGLGTRLYLRDFGLPYLGF